MYNIEEGLKRLSYLDVDLKSVSEDASLVVCLPPFSFSWAVQSRPRWVMSEAPGSRQLTTARTKL